MRRYFAYACLFFAVAMTVLSGALYGEVKRRKSNNVERAECTQQLESLPNDIGEWKLQETIDLPDGVVKMLEDPGYVYRRYVHERTGESVSVIVIVGATGPIAVHTPAVCYPSRNFEIVKTDTLTIETPGKDSVVWTTQFESKGLEKDRMQVCHAWTDDGVWEASENPRLSYCFRPFLCKIQLVSPLPPEVDDPNAVMTKFLSDFLPAIRKHVFEQL